jgi:hypothetical protein
MSDLDREYVETKPPMWLIALSVVALLAALGSLGWSLGLQNHLEVAERDLQTANTTNTQLSEKIEDTNERLKAQGQALAQSVGLTQKQVGAVQTDVSAVKTDVGGVKTDVASTQADLQQTKTQLTRVMGDAGVMSGLIATNHDELEELKHKGDRNYYEFTLHKGGGAQTVGTVKLDLKKVDVKRSKYTLTVSSDDKNIEKKDKNLDEPVQFYSGKSPMLFELVVNSIAKNTVSGYLSTPKSAPTPMTMP